MNMKKLLASLTAGSLCLGAAAAIPKPTIAADTQYRIMCVGDSITDGYINGDNGYRKYLCYYLQQNGISYDMVGPQNSWSDSATYDWNGTTITYDPAHCGYSGYSTMSYSGRTGIYETLFSSSNLMETYDPDMVLLQIGTNDLLDASLDIRTGIGDIRETTTALDRLGTVVDKILENMDSTDVLFVTTIPDIDAVTRADWVSSYTWTYNITADELPAKVQECVDAYNAGVSALVAEKQAAGYNVQFADINSVVDYTAGDLEDGVHPSEQGYAKMGAHWAEKITSYLNDGGAVIVPPTMEETTESDVVETETAPSETTSEPTESTEETTTSESDPNVTKGEGNSWVINVKDASKVIITAKIAANSGANGCVGYSSAESDWNQVDWTGSADADGDLVYEFEIPEGVTSLQYQVWWPSEVASVSAELIYQDETEPPAETTTTAATTAETTETTTTETETETTVTETTEEDSDVNEDTTLGDVNLDGDLSILDILTLQKYLLVNTSLSRDAYLMADMNQDGVVDGFDLALLKRAVLEANLPITTFPV